MRSTATGYAWRSYAPTPEAATVTCSVSGAELGDAVPTVDGVDGCEGAGVAEECGIVPAHAVIARARRATGSCRNTWRW